MTLQAVPIDTPVDGPPWHVRLTVVWRDEQLPVPITDHARSTAAGFGVRLATRPGSCVAHFVVSADSAAVAISRALTHWSDVVDDSGLPRWEIVSFSVDQVDDAELPLLD